MRQWKIEQNLEVGNSFLLEFKEMKKGGCWRLGGIADEELIIQPYYLANISRQWLGVSNNSVLLLETRKKLIVVKKVEGEKDC